MGARYHAKTAVHTRIDELHADESDDNKQVPSALESNKNKERFTGSYDLFIH